MKSVTTTALCLAAGVSLGNSEALAWGNDGHRVIGAIADIVLEQHPNTKAKVDALLHASLSEAATWADCAKGRTYCDRPPSAREIAYRDRNPAHRGYHYTDVAEQEDRYELGMAGTDPHDVVQVLRYAIGLLRGAKQPKNAAANLTRDEAVWVIAHLVGDIHQPLHVGAAYFDSTCEERVDPNLVAKPPTFGIGVTVAETTGGNDLALSGGEDNLHHYWDTVAVYAAAGVPEGQSLDVQAFAHRLASAPPAGWQTSGAPSTWSGKWANEIMPLAREALDRVTIDTATPVHTNKLKCRWHISHDAAYADWASQRSAEQLAKAGQRLAAIMIAAFGP